MTIEVSTGSIKDHAHAGLNRAIVDWTVQENAGQYITAQDNTQTTFDNTMKDKTLLYKTIKNCTRTSGQYKNVKGNR